MLTLSSHAIPRTALPFYCQFSAGALAGVTELLCLYPLDVVKTRMQLQGASVPAADRYNGMMDCFRKIIASEGPGRLYRGIVPPLMLEAPKRAVKFAANDFWAKTYRSAFGTDQMTQGLSVLTGCSAGATESVVVVPFELVKIRLQDKAQAHLYKGPMDVVSKIVKADGVLGLYAGMESTFWRHVLWNGGEWARSSRRDSWGRHGTAVTDSSSLTRRLLWLHLPGTVPPPQGKRQGRGASQQLHLGCHWWLRWYRTQHARRCRQVEDP